MLSFDYRDRVRRVQPYGLVHRRGRWYLVGAEVGSDDIKVFRLDRAEESQIGDRADAFTPPPDVDPAAAVLQQPWDAGDDRLVATVVFDEDVAWIAEREIGSGRQRSTVALDGSIVATVRGRSPRGILGLARRLRGPGRDRRTRSPARAATSPWWTDHDELTEDRRSYQPTARDAAVGNRQPRRLGGRDL